MLISTSWASPDKRKMRITKCVNCIHYKGNRKCEAYLESIPDEIWIENLDHTKILEGQKGKYIFEHKNAQWIKKKNEERKKDLLQNKDKYKIDFAGLLIMQISENGFNALEWEKATYEIYRIKKWDTGFGHHNFFVEKNAKKIKLEKKTGRKYRNLGRLIRDLWGLESLEKDKTFFMMRFTVYPNKGLEILGIELTKEEERKLNQSLKKSLLERKNEKK